MKSGTLRALLALMLVATQLTTCDVSFESHRAQPPCERGQRPGAAPARRPQSRRTAAAGSSDDDDVDVLIDLVEGELYAESPDGRPTIAGKGCGSPARRRGGKTLEELLVASNSEKVHARKRGHTRGQRPREAIQPHPAQSSQAHTRGADGLHTGGSDGHVATDGAVPKSRRGSAAPVRPPDKNDRTEAGVLGHQRLETSFAKGGWNPANLARMEDEESDYQAEAVCPTTNSADESSLSDLPTSSSASASRAAAHPVQRRRGQVGRRRARHGGEPSSDVLDDSSVADGEQPASWESSGSTARRRPREHGVALPSPLSGWGHTAAFIESQEDSTSASSGASSPAAARGVGAKGHLGASAPRPRSLAVANSSLARGAAREGAALVVKSSAASEAALNARLLLRLEAQQRQPVLESGVGETHRDTPQHLSDYTRLLSREGVYEVEEYRPPKKELQPDVLASSATLVALFLT